VRNDTRYLPVSERASDDEGLRMLVLATRAKRHDFQLREMPTEGSVLIEDLAFNSILAAANRALEAIARAVDAPLPSKLREQMARGEEALEELWDEASGQYYSRDAVTGALIKVPTVATFLPLWAGAPEPVRAARLVGLLRAPSGFWPHAPVPSVPTDAAEFRESGYWKGPTWLNMNWMIGEGLRDYGYSELADTLRRTSLALVEQAGFFEYFSPLTGAGYGAADFSWTAALTLDFLARAPASA
jgi:neutral trehalase